MRFGLLASHQYPVEQDLQQRLGELWDLAELGAALGYDSMFVINHFLGNLQTAQPISVLAKLVAHAGSMTLGTSVLLLPLFHPVHVAEEFATLDHLTRGRIVLGVGAGYRRNEFTAFGIDRTRRFRRMHESIALIRALWQGGPVTFSGEHFALSEQTIGIRPYRPGGPPIWIGAGSPIAIRRAAALGDAWIVPGNAPKPGWLPEAMTIHDDALRAAGREGAGREYPLIVNMFCAETTAEAETRVRPWIEREYSAYAEYPQLAFQREQFDFLWRKRFFIGSPADLVARVQSVAAHGITHLLLRTFWSGISHELVRASVRLFAEAVIPRCRDLGAPSGLAALAPGP